MLLSPAFYKSFNSKLTQTLKIEHAPRQKPSELPAKLKLHFPKDTATPAFLPPLPVLHQAPPCYAHWPIATHLSLRHKPEQPASHGAVLGPGLVRGVRAADSLGTGEGANSVESGIVGEVRRWWREGVEKGCAGLPQGLGRTPSFGLFMQEMNLLPTPESPVTRQEKMATVWDEAEVSAGRPEGRPGASARGRDVLGALGRRWLGVQVRFGLGTELLGSCC